jgi:hypothetical protein
MAARFRSGSIGLLFAGAVIAASVVIGCWALVGAASAAGAPVEQDYQSGAGSIHLQAPSSDFPSLTITSENWNGFQLTMHCPARQVYNATEYTYACTMSVVGLSSARLQGVTGSGTAHVVLLLQRDYLGNDLTIRTDQFQITLANKSTSTEYATTSGWAKVASKPVKLKIATTKSCTDKVGTGFSAQEGVTVKIGDHTFTSNANGVIEATVPAGTYSVNASWFDYPLGYVAENGLRQKPNESGVFTVQLSDPGETLEVRMLTCDPDGQPKARATILEMGKYGSGVSISVKRSRSSGSGFVGMKLRDGDTVAVRGTAKLKWLEGGGTIAFDNPRTLTIIVIGPESAPTGTKAPVNGDGQGPSVLQVLQGIGEFVMPPDDNADAPRDANGNIIKFGASTRSVNLGIKGTRFQFGYDPKTSSSTIVVEEGTVWLAPKNPSLKPFTVQAGQQVAVALNRVGPITGAPGKVRTPAPTRTHAAVPTPAGNAAVSASFGAPMYQSGQRDASGRITVESATIYPFVCHGTSFYLYQYTARAPGEAQFRAIRPPDFGHPMGGKDFLSRDQAVAAACSP